jgi:hypothetical protein
MEREQKYAPLSNFTFCNLMAEGMLTAKALFPKEFAEYEFSEPNYLRRTMRELRTRRSLGVDVSEEIGELVRYAQEKSPFLLDELLNENRSKKSLPRQLRDTIGKLGGRRLQQWMLRRQQAWKIQRGDVHSGFRVSGEDFGFSNIVGCAEFLGRVASTAE